MTQDLEGRSEVVTIHLLLLALANKVRWICLSHSKGFHISLSGHQLYGEEKQQRLRHRILIASGLLQGWCALEVYGPLVSPETSATPDHSTIL